ncbi:MAG TPA: hypothetical protein DEQ38_09360 [Elusimicrobia bacterium]|nr:MAG: hypothetical protein A2089_13655 [Elusimicrobia bacterium GWD2_63_28]HCC48302.1 hypothetical protein [Elusimicrobiota bacterium]
MKNLILAAALCLGAAPASAGAPAGAAYTEGKYFTITVPGGWTKKDEGFGLSDEEKKVFGADFFGPAADGLAVRIGVHYYAPGNLVQPTPEKFIKLHSQPAIGVNVDGKVYGKVAAGKAGNYYARVFERKTFEYEPKEALHPKKIHVYEKFHVVPVKNGFYVLRYYAPMDLAKANLKHYQAVLASFKPLAR